jgi:hypothetical protein
MRNPLTTELEERGIVVVQDLVLQEQLSWMRKARLRRLRED